MRSRKLLALLFCLITFPAIAGYMTLLGAGVGSIAPVVSWVSGTDAFPSTLSFSRTSNATMFDSTGKLTYAPNNLLLQSNTFSNAAWIKLTGGTGTAAVVTANAGTDPLGGNTASRLQCDRGAGGTSSDYSLLYQDITPGAQIKTLRSIWVKSNTGSSQSFVIYDGAGRNVGVTNTATTSWQQFALPDGAGTNNISELIIGTRGGTGQYYTGGAQTLDLLIYAAVNAAVTYETSPRTADQVITTSSAYYGPRIDYDPNTLAVKGLLIEEARTNAISASNDLSSVAWAKNGSTVTANSATGPDGQTSLAQVNKTNASNGQLYRNYSTANTKTISFYASKGSLNYVAVSMYSSIGSAFFNLNTGAVAATNNGAATVTASITAIGGGIYRCIAVFSGTFTPGELHIEPSDGTNTTQLAPWGTGGTGTINLGFVQVEEGQSFATSYIPTATASVTRAADVVQFTGTALTALQGASHSLLVQTSDVAAFGLNLAGAGNDYQQIYNSSTVFSSRNINGGLTVTLPSGTFASPQRVGYATNGTTRSVVASGAINTGSGGYAPVGSVYLGAYSSGAFMPNIHVTSLAVYNQRLPDATLQAKSVVGASYAANDNGLRFADNDNLPIHWRIAL